MVKTERSQHQLKTFRLEQLVIVVDRAKELLMFERSVRHHLETNSVLQGRELPSVRALFSRPLKEP